MKSIIKKLFKNKRQLMLVVVVASLAVFLLPHMALAQEAATAGSTQGSNELYQQVVKFLLLVMEFLQRLIWPVLLMIGGLLKNDLLFAAGMEEVMLTIWENIRNIVNILFVIILLGIAFYNVVGGSSQDYHIKAILPRFVIALIVVNFSFLGVKVVLDGVNVVSTAIFALPGAVETGLKDGEKFKKLDATNAEFQKSVCEEFHGKDPAQYTVSISKAEEAAQSNPDNKPFCTADYAFTDKALNFFAQYDSNNAAIVLAINLMEINGLDVVKVTQPNAKNLAINVLFSIVLYIVYAVSFVALLIILLVRLVVLWVTMVMSPLIALAFVLPDSLKSTLGSGGDLKTQFVKNAIVPIPVALTMSIGFIMLQSLKQAKFSSEGLSTSTLGVNLLTSGLGTLQDLIVAVGTVAIIWIGVFKAAEGTAAQGIVEKIKGATEGFGKFVATAPLKYTPIIPVKEGGEKVSLGTALGALGRIPSAMQDTENRKVNDLLREHGLGGVSTETSNKLRDPKAKPEQLMQTLINNRHKAGDEYMQKEIAKGFENRNSAYKSRFIAWNELKSEDGKAFKNANEAIKALQGGKVDEKSLQSWMDKNARHLNVSQQNAAPTTPPGTAGQQPGTSGAPGKTGGPPPPTPGTTGAAKVGAATAAGAAAANAGAQPAIGDGMGKTLIGSKNFDKRKATLNTQDQAALDAYKKGEKQHSDTEVQKALDKLLGLQAGTAKFLVEVKGKPEADQKKIIASRKVEVEEHIKKNNPGLEGDQLTEKINDIVQDEVRQAGLKHDVTKIEAKKEEG